MLEILNFFAEDRERTLGLIAVILATCWGLSWVLASWRSGRAE